MEGLEDPFNRGPYPWGSEDAALIAFHQALGRLRAERPSLQRGDLRYLYAKGSGLAFSRTQDGETTLLALNAGTAPLSMELPWAGRMAKDALQGQQFHVPDGRLRITLPPLSGLLLI